MSDYVSYPAEGISHLIIEVMAQDAVLRGAAEATTIQVHGVPADRQAPSPFVAEGPTARFSGTAAQVTVPEKLAVTVKEARGDLRVLRTAGEITLEAVHGDVRLESLGGPVRIGRADADLRAEEVAELRVAGICSGDLRFANGGLLAVETAMGDARLLATGEVRLGRVHGDLWVEKVAGIVQVDRTDGDARLSEVAGLVTLGPVAGDLRGSGLAGGLSASHVTGDVVLQGPYVAAAGYAVSADGDLHLHLPADANVRLTIRAAGRVRSDVPLTPSADGSPTFSATLGQGGCRVNLVGRGDVRITQAGAQEVRSGWKTRDRMQADAFAELGNLGERIRQQVAASLAAAGINVETGEFTWSGMERFRGRGARGARPPTPPERPRPPTPPERPRPPAGPSAEEQLAVLKMVEEGKISAEEAETLLKALNTQA